MRKITINLAAVAAFCIVVASPALALGGFRLPGAPDKKMPKISFPFSGNRACFYPWISLE